MWAFGYNLIALPIAMLFGWFWISIPNFEFAIFAAAAMVFSDLTVVLNSLDLVHNYNILHLPNYKIHFHLYIYLIFVLHLENNIIKIVDKIEGYVPSLLYYRWKKIKY
ncbi:hypothetical protein [Spiroplasma endosymbiont of Asaphidion curtum]|uniref:hypothetical protein n=1 Tax=Spiroplasma endosymbiont of Asaphidion curtum TaxID=3066281 RepID=UPI00313B5904